MSNAVLTMKVAFNTGVHYSAKGQRIAVWVRKLEREGHEICCLVDFDRHMCCIFPIKPCPGLDRPTDLCKHAMHMYQWGQYDLCCPLPERLEVLEDLRSVLSQGYDEYARQHDVTVIAGMKDRLAGTH